MAQVGVSLAERVEHLVGPVLSSQGYELIWVEFVARGKILRLYVDRSEGVTLDDCARVSRMVGDVLDAEGLSDAIQGRYTLEVSSPGLDRPLVRPQHYQRFLGRQVKVVSREAVGGRRNFTGELTQADEVGILLQVDGRSYALSYSAIERARLVPQL